MHVKAYAVHINYALCIHGNIFQGLNMFLKTRRPTRTLNYADKGYQPDPLQIVPALALRRHHPSRILLC